MTGPMNDNGMDAHDAYDDMYDHDMTFEEVQRALGADPEPQTHDPTDLSVILTFGDAKGRECRIPVAELLRAFLALDQEGLIPDPGADWRKAMAGHLAAAPGTEDETLAHYVRLERVAEGMCDCCGAVCHAVFHVGTENFRIERWAVVTSTMVLEDRGFLLPLPLQWYQRLETNYESICETGRYILTSGQSGAEDV